MKFDYIMSLALTMVLQQLENGRELESLSAWVHLDSTPDKCRMHFDLSSIAHTNKHTRSQPLVANLDAKHVTTAAYNRRGIVETMAAAVLPFL